MPGSSPVVGNVAFSQAIYASLAAASAVTGGTSSTSTYTILGLVVGDMIDLYPQAALPNYLAVGAVWVSALNTLSISWTNAGSSTSPTTPAAQTFAILVNRAQLSPYGVTNWPTALE